MEKSTKNKISFSSLLKTPLSINISRKNLKFLHIFLFIAITITICSLAFTINFLNLKISLLEGKPLNEKTSNNQDGMPNSPNSLEESSEVDSNNDSSCIKVGNSLKDIYPLKECNESEITVNNVLLDGRKVSIRASFNSLLGWDTEFYTLSLYINDQKVENSIFSVEGKDGELPSYIIDANAFQVFTMSENFEPKALVIISQVAAQCCDIFIEIINEKGEIIFTDKNVNIPDVFLQEPENINTLQIEKENLECPWFECEEVIKDLDKDTVCSEKYIYTLKEGRIEILHSLVNTFGDLCPEQTN